MFATHSWKYLLWKDFQQVKVLFLACLVCLMASQILVTAVELLDPKTSGGVAVAAFAFALICPTLLALGVAGMTIGNERQTRTWGWCSSLPMTWQQAFASKVLVWVITGVCSLCILLAVAIVCNLVVGRELPWSTTTSEFGSFAMVQVYAMGVGLCALVFFSIATTILNDTILATSFTGVAIAVVSFILGESPDLFAMEIVGVRFIALTLFSAGLLATLTAFRWRWGRGQFSSFSSVRATFVRAPVGSALAMWQCYSTQFRRPLEMWMLLVQSLRGSLVLLGLTLLIIALPSVVNGTRHEALHSILLTLALPFASILLGTSMFASDQTLSQFRFLADRGADWQRVFVCRFASRSILLALLLVTAYEYEYTPDQMRSGLAGLSPKWLLVAGFCLGMYASLCMANTVVATAVASLTLLLLLLTVLIFGTVEKYFQICFIDDPRWLARWFPPSLLVVISSAIYLTSRWLVHERIHGARAYCITMVICVCLPIAISMSTCFLTAPYVRWQGADLVSTVQRVTLHGPALDTKTPPLVLTDEPFSALASNSRRIGRPSGHSESPFTAVLESTLRERVNSIIRNAEDAPFLPGLISRLDDVRRDLQSPKEINSDLVTYAIRLNEEITTCSLVATFATHNRKRDMAIQSWDVVYELLRVAEQPHFLVPTLDSRLLTWGLWNEFTNEELRLLSGTEFLMNLTSYAQPEHPSAFEIASVVELLKIRASLLREALRGRTLPEHSLFYYHLHDTFPARIDALPLLGVRWRSERLIARQLADDIQRISSRAFESFYDYSDTIAVEFSHVWQLQNRLRNRIATPANAESATQDNRISHEK